MICDENGSDDFNELEAFDAFMEIVERHPNRRKPTEIDAYINEASAFFRAVYNMGVADGFDVFLQADKTIKKDI